MKSRNKTMVWWGRSDPAYSRNAIMIQALEALGWTISYFRPHISATAHIEALFRLRKCPGAVWVPAFRQRDFFGARRFARLMDIPVIFDPLISAYDKRVLEFKKLEVNTPKARKLLQRERAMFSSADLILADTTAHKTFFEEQLNTSPERCFVVPVGADESIFTPQASHPLGRPPEALFYGSFLPLHGVETVIEAARICPEVQWTLIGNGHLRAQCEELAKGVKNLRIESAIPYENLPIRIGQADILLGVFGTTPKAERVIPNKVFQALACARPVITRESPAYPAEACIESGGLTFVPPGDPQALANAIRLLLESEAELRKRGEQAARTFSDLFSMDQTINALDLALRSTSLQTR
ncbi:MAG: glycosyltransferase [Pontiellaceae bacterium]|nr:glycosyltransferase [Pontiellaceae bacterium]